MEGKEEYKEILKIIPGTVEFDTQVQFEINRLNQLKITQLENRMANYVRKVCIIIIIIIVKLIIKVYLA